MTSMQTAPYSHPISDESEQVTRILVVEDDRDLAEIVGRVASAVDDTVRCQIATTANLAKEYLERDAFDFVLMDHFLDGDVHGIDLVEPVRKHQPNAVLAMMSSMDLGRLVDLTSGQNNIQLLPKPFSAQLLRAFLHDVMGPVCPDPQSC